MIEKVLIVILAAGIVIVTLPDMEGLYIGIYARAKKWVYGFRNADIWHTIEEENLEDKFSEHLKRLLGATFGMGTRQSVTAFFVISLVSGTAVFLLLAVKTSLMVAAFSGGFVLMLPYTALQVRLQRLRVDSSREGDILITELLNNYKINFYNMQEAIENTAVSIENAPNSKKLLFNLSKGLNKVSEEKDVKLLLDEFRFSINTSWANILATNMFLALTSGIKVTDALVEMSKTISRARKVDEYSKRENNEAGWMLKYLAPACYMLTLCGGVKYFGITFGEYLKYQFSTSAGLTWFSVSLMLYVAGIMANAVISKGKLDL